MAWKLREPRQLCFFVPSPANAALIIRNDEVVGSIPTSSTNNSINYNPHGKEVREGLHGPVTPGLPAPSIGTAALSFKLRFGREPVAGDVLRYQDVFLCDLVRYGKFITAWSRQIPELPCPLKIEDGHIFCHEDPRYNDGQEWNGPDEPTLSHWSCVEAEANDGKHLLPRTHPRFPPLSS